MVRTRIHLLGREFPAFRVCGLTGLSLALALGTALTWHMGLSLSILAAIVCVVSATFFALALATKVVTGREKLVYYHHEIAVLAATFLLLRCLRQPAPPYLDIVALGIG